MPGRAQARCAVCLIRAFACPKSRMQVLVRKQAQNLLDAFQVLTVF